MTTSRKPTKSTQRALAAMKFEVESLVADGQVPAGRQVALSFRSIYRAACFMTSRRKPTEAEIFSGLRHLVASGQVEKETVVGMGGGFTTYTLID